MYGFRPVSALEEPGRHQEYDDPVPAPDLVSPPLEVSSPGFVAGLHPFNLTQPAASTGSYHEANALLRIAFPTQPWKGRQGG